MKRTLIQGHRGASAYAPENTLPAFKMAAEMNADGIELDVHLTKDGEIVVCHDAQIDRTSDGIGSICDYTLEDLKKFSFHGAFAEKYHGTKIPTLDEVFELVKSMCSHDFKVNIELKDAGFEFVRAVKECTYRNQMQNNVIYSSFTFENLTDMLKIDADAFVAPLYGSMENPWDYAKSIGAKAIHPNWQDVVNNDGYVDKAHELGIRVHPWTVDDENVIRRLAELGVDEIISNKPDVALKVVNSIF